MFREVKTIMWIESVAGPRLTNTVKHGMTHWPPLSNANPLMAQPMSNLTCRWADRNRIAGWYHWLCLQGHA